MFRQIVEDAKKFGIEEVAYDRNLAEYLIQDLESEFTCVEFNQGITGMSEPSKAWEQAVAEGKIIDNNPVMAWMVSCTTVKPDANGNIKPIKPDTNKTSKRIDGVITSIMANNRLEVAIADEEKQASISVEDYVF
jgi:phage terminase large subunit-like protein